MSSAMPQIRAIADEAEFTQWLNAFLAGFLSAAPSTPEAVAGLWAHTDPARVQGAFDRGHCVGTFYSFTHQVTLPGGAPLTSNAVTDVSVAATHRRRGLLSSMMATDLAAARDRGDAVASLIAAEYPIYGRYGFGPATAFTTYEIDVRRTGLDPRRTGAPDCGGQIDFADGAEVREVGPALHERFRRRQHGAVSRDSYWWQLNTGAAPSLMLPWREAFHVLYRSRDGQVEGLATYRADDTWAESNQPRVTVTVADFVTVSAAADRALWQFLCSIDWVARVRTNALAPDTLLPELLPDPRACRTVTHSDHLWLRVLDVCAALQARTYQAQGSLVLQVRDAAGFADGRYLLSTTETMPDAAQATATCTPTRSAADLALDVAELGRLLLGDTSAVRLARLGRITEERPGAAALADRLLRTPLRPWCPDVF